MEKSHPTSFLLFTHKWELAYRLRRCNNSSRNNALGVIKVDREIQSDLAEVTYWQ